MAATSAGILLYRLVPALEVLIAHMGGPFWTTKDEGAWTIPKGEFDPALESARGAACREFREELGVDPPAVPLAELGTFRTAAGKLVTIFVADGTGVDLSAPTFGTFEMEWPPRSGRMQTFPEVDRVQWMTADAASPLLVKSQRPALDALIAHLSTTDQR